MSTNDDSRFVVKWHSPGQKPSEGLRYHTDDIDEAVEVFRSYTRCGFLTSITNRRACNEIGESFPSPPP